MNATRNNSDIDVYRDNLAQQNVVNNENTHSSGENFFHDDYDSILKSQTDGVDSLERLLIEDINDDKAGETESTIPLTRKLESDQDDRKSSSEENILQLGNRTNNTRPSIFQRIRPLDTIKRAFGGLSSDRNDTISIDTDTGQGINGNFSDELIDDNKPSIRNLWRKRQRRTLDEGVGKERQNALSFLMNKAIANAKQSQERSYVERSLMGLINGLAEEVEDLDIDINTTSKTPFWRKEVEEIRINFSRLGFRPLQLGGTNSVMEIVGLDKDYTIENDILNDELDAFVVDPSRRFQEVGETISGAAELSFVECADEGFDRIDEDGSGTLDKDELAQALNSISGLKTNKDSIEELASDLVRLYDDNGDGVVDREEYQRMVEDMAKLRALKEEEAEKDQKNPFVAVKDSIQSVSEGISSKAGEVVSAARDKYFSEKPEEDEDETEMGSIVLSKVNLDLRRLVFGAVPIVKKITPGGPLILEPFTATVTASFSREDVMGSFLLDDALKRLIARTLRVRVRSYRDLTEGALFVGRRWMMNTKTAPVVEVLELCNVEFDSRDKMIITGRARIRADPDASIVTSTFKLRTSVGTRKNGQVIKLKEMELAFVFECPKSLERGLAAACKTFGLPPPKRPEPYYSFIPLYSPFQVDDDTGGFDLGEDNCIRSIFIKNGKLRFEMSVVLRPGRFLGNHYLAFTVPQRTFIITMDRVWNGVRAARENKQVADRAKKLKAAEEAMEIEVIENSNDPSSASVPSSESPTSTSQPNSTISSDSQNESKTSRWRFFKTIKENTPKPKSFYTRFVEGYTMVEREEEANNKRITNDISDWFGRQGRTDDTISTVVDDKDESIDVD